MTPSHGVVCMIPGTLVPGTTWYEFTWYSQLQSIPDSVSGYMIVDSMLLSVLYWCRYYRYMLATSKGERLGPSYYVCTVVHVHVPTTTLHSDIAFVAGTGVVPTYILVCHLLAEHFAGLLAISKLDDVYNMGTVCTNVQK